jgi:hypothetical protein
MEDHYLEKDNKKKVEESIIFYYFKERDNRIFKKENKCSKKEIKQGIKR